MPAQAVSADRNGIDAAAAERLHVGLVGRSIRRSRTPHMHEAEGRILGLNYTYELIDTDVGAKGTLAKIVDAAEARGFAGLNVTHPFKREVTGLVEELSDAARRIGAVNTIVFRDGRRFGHNTDFWGFSASFRLDLPDVKLGTVLLLGAGGAGGAVGHALHHLAADRLLIFDTREEAAKALATSLNAAAGREAAEAITDVSRAAARADGIVNATPVGMAKVPGTPIDARFIERRHWVADIIYFPLNTELLEVARTTGCRTLSGEGMAVFQAVRAFELFSGVRPDADRMRETFRSLGEV